MQSLFSSFFFSSKIVAQNWIGTSGPNTSIPVMAHINGIYQFDNKMMNADVNFVFSDFQTNSPDFTLFMPPPDIWCQGRKMDQELRALPDFFSYTSEAMWHIDLPVITGEHSMAMILSTRWEAYDHLQKG